MKLLLTRVFLILVALSTWTPTCMPQQTPKAYRIGIISAGDRLTDGSPTREAFQQELHKSAYLRGATVLIVQRNAAGKYDRLPDLLADLIALKVDVIVAAGTTEA